ncbi:dihydroorotate dehydrogenase-like protein [bacterium CPR1]|nr:dihydroorotate dehydrogenase-like protein [bacterium CPR1]
MRPDLRTRYLGMTLEHPLIPSASPLTSSLDGLKRLEDAGAPAVVLASLFEEQVDLQHELAESIRHQGAEAYAEAVSYFPPLREYRVQADEYLELVEGARRRLGIPVIASLNGCTSGGWVGYASRLERAGAHALELNLYHLAADPERSGAEVEQRYLEIVQGVRQQIHIPLAVKLGPQLSSPVHFVRQLEKAGASAVVIWNRFYQCNLDLEQLEVVPHLELSRSYEMLSALTWTAVMFARVGLDLAVTGGAHTVEDVLKALMAGASAVQMASELLLHGPERLSQLVLELGHWMREREYLSVEQLKGSMSQQRVAEPAVYLRANYLRTLQYGGERWRG